MSRLQLAFPKASEVDRSGSFPDNIRVVHKILLVYEEYTELTSVQSALIRVGFDVLGITTEYTLGENVLSFNPDVVLTLGRGGKVSTLGVGRRLREMTRWQGKAILILPAGYKPKPEDFGKVRADMLLEAPVPIQRLVQVLAKILDMDEIATVERLNKTAEAIPTEEAPAIIPNLKLDGRDESVRVTGSALKDGKDRWTFDMDVDKSKKTKEPDLENLWKELTQDSELHHVKGSAPKAVGSEKVSFELRERQGILSENEMQDVSKSISDGRKGEHERVSKYAKFTEKLTQFDPRKSLGKVAARKAQKELASSWNQGDIQSQDKARQEFTKALFRKK
ncbi:MAG: hypothetical protein H7326_04955 [Bdellovibrionaceae bacterium]|nr:hypothetical protein [Pseudobdellovibrionaceae bacterium]